MIDSSEISVVVQGHTDRETLVRVTKSLRRCLPEAQIILSVWEKTCAQGADYDEAVFLPALEKTRFYDEDDNRNNVNRQIFTVQAGLEKVRRAYTLKIRSDILLRSRGFLEFFERYQERRSGEGVFENRLVVCNYYTKNPRVVPLPFHPSDWFVFGKSADVRRLYEIPFMDGAALNWFSVRKKEILLYTGYTGQFTPEQHIFLSCVQKYCPASCCCYYDATPENVRLTERLFADNFIVLDYQKQLDIIFTKYPPNRFLDSASLLSHRHWKALYRRYSMGERRGWGVYRLSMAGKRLGAFWLRTALVGMMERLHIKKSVKAFLGK